MCVYTYVCHTLYYLVMLPIFSCCSKLPYTWNFSWHVYFTVEHETRIFAVEGHPKNCAFFAPSAIQGYVRKVYATNLSEIDKTLYQIAYHSRGNPRPPCGKSWDWIGSYCHRWANQSGPIISPWIIKKITCRCMRWHVVHGQLECHSLKTDRIRILRILTSRSQFKVSSIRTDRS